MHANEERGGLGVVPECESVPTNKFAPEYFQGLRNEIGRAHV